MTDREKVIQRLEECLSASCRGFRTCPYSDDDWDVVREAVTLLKEPEIVRCKDCIYYNSKPDSHGDYCDKIHWSRGLNWFCADGEKKVSEDA